MRPIVLIIKLRIMKKVATAVLAGIIGAAVMSVVTMIGGAMGMPKMSQPKMLSGMMGLSIALGWVMHFMVGIVFAVVYIYLYDPLLRIANTYLKGAIFGIIVFIFAQVMMAIMPVPPIEGSMLAIVLGGLMGHIIFGMVVSLTAGNSHSSKVSCKTSQ